MSGFNTVHHLPKNQSPMNSFWAITTGSEASYPSSFRTWQPESKGLGRLEIFMGQPAENAKRWVEKFKELATVNNWNTLDKKKVQMASLMEGIARGWWEAKKISSKGTWDEIEQAFLQAFDSQQEGQLYHAINNRNQLPYEPVANYVYDIENLFNRIDGNLPEKQKIQYLLKGLLPYLKEHLL